MSFSWSTARTKLAELVTTATGLRVQWADGPAQWGGSLSSTPAIEAHCEMSLKTVGGRGVDHLTHVYNADAAPGEEITYHCIGVRAILWQVRFRSLRSSAALDAVYYADMLRSHLRAPYADDLLRGSSLGVEAVNQSVDLGAYLGDRRESVAQVDIMLVASIDQVVQTDTIVDRVIGEIVLNDVNGDDLPTIDIDITTGD